MRNVLGSVGCAGVVALLGCGDARVLATEWPATDDDVVFVVRAQGSGQGQIHGVYIGRPTVNFDLIGEEDTFLIVVPADELRSLHFAIDLTLSGLAGATPAGEVRLECTSQVRTADQTINVELPPSEVFELDRATSGFVSSSASVVGLLGSERMQLKLREEPCRASMAPTRFEVQGEFVSPGESSAGLNDIARIGDTIFAVSASRIYVLRRNLPSVSLALPVGQPSRYFAKRIAARAGSANETDLVVSVPSIQAGQSELRWYRWDGNSLIERGNVSLPHAVYEIAVDSDGLFVTGGASTPVMTLGTLTSTQVQTLDVPFLDSVTNVAFSDTGELAIASQSNLLRARLGTLSSGRITRLLNRGGVPVDSQIRGLDWVGDTVYVMSPEEGLFAAQPNLQTVEPVEVGVISSDSDCGFMTACSGYNRVANGFESARADFGMQMLFYTTDRCPILTGYVPETGCATEIAVNEIAGRLFADDRGLIFTSGFEVFEIPASAFDSQ